MLVLMYKVCWSCTVCMTGQEFCDRCEPAREVTMMGKKTFKPLAWEEWVQFLREHQDEIMSGSTDPLLPDPEPEMVVPQTREDVVRQAFPLFSASQVKAALVVEDEIVPLFHDGQLTDQVFMGDAGWWSCKAAPL